MSDLFIILLLYAQTKGAGHDNQIKQTI